MVNDYRMIDDCIEMAKKLSIGKVTLEETLFAIDTRMASVLSEGVKERIQNLRNYLEGLNL